MQLRCHLGGGAGIRDWIGGFGAFFTSFCPPFILMPPYGSAGISAVGFDLTFGFHFHIAAPQVLQGKRQGCLAEHFCGVCG
jgi:hypothetical protein